MVATARRPAATKAARPTKNGWGMSKSPDEEKRTGEMGPVYQLRSERDLRCGAPFRKWRRVLRRRKLLGANETSRVFVGRNLDDDGRNVVESTTTVRLGDERMDLALRFGA